MASFKQFMKPLIAIVIFLYAISLQAQTYEITECDFAYLRTGPGTNFPHPWKLQRGVNGIVLLGDPVFNGPTKWQKVNSRGVVGWINANLLKEDKRVTVIPPPAPTPNPTPTVATPSPESNDCLIVATEAYARLKPNAYWAKICIFRIYKNSEYKYSHAIVLYQPTLTSNVFFATRNWDQSIRYTISRFG
jgi:hypothetical protein